MNIAVGIDVGGSGIKGAPVDLDTGKLLVERYRVKTPNPSKPDAVVDVIKRVVAGIEKSKIVGCTFPGVVQNGVIYHATNFDPSWEGYKAAKRLSADLDVPVTMLNDADAAGLAEMEYGAGAEFGHKGVVMMLTFGTGIGSSIFVNGQIFPNTELGSLELSGHIAESRAAGRLRENDVIGWKKWIKRVQKYLSFVEELFWPDLIIFGGGISAQSEIFLDKLETRAKLVPAKLKNNAGIAGAALAAARAAKAL